MLSSFEIFSILGHTPLGVIPENDDVNCNLRLHDNRRAFDMLATNLQTGAFEVFDCVSPYKGIFGKMRRRFKRNV